MAGINLNDEYDVVRVKVKKFDGLMQPEFRTFSVDPQITSLDVLHHILVRAFELSGKKNFVLSYLCQEPSGEEMYLSLLSDWDLKSAFGSASKPFLQLRIDVKPFEESPVLEDWDIISPKELPGSEVTLWERKSLNVGPIPLLTQSLISQVGRTLSKVQQVLSWSYTEDVARPLKPPLGDAEFHSFLSRDGQLVRPEELRLRVYHGGLEPSLRKVVWRHLLNVYPEGLTAQERLDYMKKKSKEYEALKSQWSMQANKEELEFTVGMVLKDVLRTDRTLPYYAGSDDNLHVRALHDLLITYAVNHPRVSYCQGMSDIASPILFIMDNEAHAYVCFCGIMKRLRGNFLPDGEVMSTKFRHLALLLRFYDPEFHNYLVSCGASDLLFCYRWLLLDLKREFAFEDALRMLEIMWSSLPPDPPQVELELKGAPLDGTECSQQAPHRRMVRPQMTSAACRTAGAAPGTFPAQPRAALAKSQPENYRTPTLTPTGAGATVASVGAVPNGNVFQMAPCPVGNLNVTARDERCLGLVAGRRPSLRKSSGSAASEISEEDEDEEKPLMSPKVLEPDPDTSALEQMRRSASSLSLSFKASLLSVAGHKLGNAPPALINAKAIEPGSPVVQPAQSLPPPPEFGKGNPFVLFMCLAILLEHRDHIMRNALDYNDLAMHFDRLVRKHNVGKILHRAKELFADYLRGETWCSEEGAEAQAADVEQASR